MLIGYVDDQTYAPVVIDCVGPGPEAVHTRTTYEPDYDYQEQELGRRYAQWNQRATYLGDWHSHPGGTLALSATDKQTLRAIATHNPARTSQPIILIAGGRDTWQLAAWQHCRKGRWTRPRVYQIMDIKVFGSADLDFR